MFNHSNSPRISVSGGTLSFNVVHGNQSNSRTRSPQDRHRFPPGEEWKEELYREYERMPTGRIKLVNTIFETGVARRTYEGSRSMSLIEGSDTSRAKRILHLACTASETWESPPFLLVKYTGRDARRAFKMDALQFSQLRDPLFPQLRGFSDSEIPIIIFHDLLIPAAHAIQHDQNSPAILCYLRLQGETAFSNLAYNNSALFDYLVQNATSDFVLSALSQQYMWINPDEMDCCQHIPRVRSRFHQQLVAKFPETTWTFTFHCVSFESKPAKTLVDGRTRLTISNRYIEHGSLDFHFRQDQTPCNYDEAWLCQAIHVFHVLDIPREEWESFTLLPYYGLIWFSLTPSVRGQSRQDCDYRFDPPYYLFILPPPQLPDKAPDVASWIQAPAESSYYWSADPDGKSRMSKAHYMALGLPCFDKSISRSIGPRVWKAEIYDLVRQWQEAKGYDPTTTDFVRSMGYPIVEILPQDINCFDTYVEDDESTDRKPHEQALEPMQVDEAFETISISQNPSFSPQISEESASMDVDMEDCSDRMASLRIEAMLIDE
ncbi:hypothetical protein PQX77_009276 [Marasmius sp. AFHP31]|nr:hypothetical protein PQX77_009276 [Marasmius sp. AFHP31]